MKKNPRLTEHEFISYVLMDNKEAIALANQLFFVSQVWDDLIDGDNPTDPDTINRMMWVLLVDIHMNRFFHDNFAHLLPIIRSSIRDWLDANEFEREAAKNPKRKNSTELRAAYILRDSIGVIITEMAYLIGGYDWMRQVSPEVRKWVHDETYEEYTKGIIGGR